MKKTIVMILSLAMVLALSVCTFAAPTDFDPTLDIDTSADGKTITVTMNGLPDGVAAELTIPCDGWSSATVKDSSGKVVKSTFGKTDANPDPAVEQLVDAVTFEAEGGTYTITKGSVPTGGYYPVLTPDKDTTEEKPTETKPTTPAQPATPPAEDVVAPTPEDTTPVVPDEPPVIDDGAVDDAPAVDEPQGGNAGLWIGVGIVALAAIVVVLIVMIARKKRK